MKAHSDRNGVRRFGSRRPCPCRESQFAFPRRSCAATGAATGIGLINAVGNLGGFIGPYLMGGLRDWFGDFATGLFALAGAAPLSSALVMTARAGEGSNKATTT